jgi:hypothetical protein
MANNSFLSELLQSLGDAIRSLTGWTQAAHEEARGARVAAEKSGGRSFDVLDGLPAGSGNARSITSMLAGKSPPVPRMRSPARQSSGQEESGGDSPTESIAHSMGRIVGNIFRRIAGGSGSVGGAGAASGQSGMGAGLAIRGGAAAMGVAGAVGGPLVAGLAIHSVAKALQNFGERINEQSRGLRAYSSGTNVAFASLDRTKGIAQQRYATGTAESLQESTKAQGEALLNKVPWNEFWGNFWNGLSGNASKVSGLWNTFLSGLVTPHGWSKVADELTEAAMSPEEKEKNRLKKLAPFGQITEAFLNPHDEKGNPKDMTRSPFPNLSLHKQATLGTLDSQIADMLGNMGNARGFNRDALGAAFDPGNLEMIGGRPPTGLDADKAAGLPNAFEIEEQKKRHSPDARAKRKEQYQKGRERRRDAFRLRRPGIAALQDRQKERQERIRERNRKKTDDFRKKRLEEKDIDKLIRETRQEEINRSNFSIRDLHESLSQMKNRPSLLKPGE